MQPIHIHFHDNDESDPPERSENLCDDSGKSDVSIGTVMLGTAHIQTPTLGKVKEFLEEVSPDGFEQNEASVMPAQSKVVTKSHDAFHHVEVTLNTQPVSLHLCYSCILTCYGKSCHSETSRNNISGLDWFHPRNHCTIWLFLCLGSR